MHVQYVEVNLSLCDMQMTFDLLQEVIFEF